MENVYITIIAAPFERQFFILRAHELVMRRLARSTECKTQFLKGVYTMENTTISEVTEITRDEFLAKMAAAKERLLELCSMSLRAYTDPEFSPTWDEILLEATGLVETFNWASNQAEFISCAESDDPMRAIVERFTRLNASVKERKKDVGGGEVHFLELDISEKQLDLLKFSKYYEDKYEGKIGKGDWYSAIQQLGLRLTLKVAASIGYTGAKLREIDDSFNMTKLAREVQLAKEDESGATPDPVSKRQMVTTLNMIIDLMLGFGSCDSRDVGFLLNVFGRKDRAALCVKTATTKELVGYIHQIAHRVAMGKEYSVNCYTKKSR